MLAFTNVIVQLNMFTFRQQVGLAINAAFVNVSNKNLDDFNVLAWIEFLCAFIPFTFIALMVPSIAETDQEQERIRKSEVEEPPNGDYQRKNQIN